MTDNPQPNNPPDASNSSGDQTVTAADITYVVQTVRGMVANGRKDEARRLLNRVVERAPQYEEPWLQLLALEPPPAEEIPLLRAFLQHHADHRYAKAFRTRLQDLEIVAMLHGSATPETSAPQPAASALRLGDFLIANGWVTTEQVEHALQEQRRLGKSGVGQRLGTILLRNGHLNQDQLAFALAKGRTVGLGEFGSYLVRHGILTPEQVGQALARQAALVAEQERGYLNALQRLRNKVQPSRKPIPRLGEVMVQMGMLTTEQVEAALRDRQTEFNTHFD